jgi:hypothetical protein
MAGRFGGGDSEMNPLRKGRLALVVTFCFLAGWLAGCAGYYGGGGGDWGPGYYDTGVVDYGGWGDWGGGYRVGPYRDRGGHFDRDRGRGGRAIPGIPAGRRGGGFHGGGGGRGGR